MGSLNPLEHGIRGGGHISDKGIHDIFGALNPVLSFRVSLTTGVSKIYLLHRRYEERN